MQKLTNLPVGAKVKFGKYSVNGETPERIEWIVVNHGAYVHPMNENLVQSCTFLLSRYIVDLRAFDAQESGGGTFRENYGNSDFHNSNLITWLNSYAAAGEWFSGNILYDEPPTDDRITGGTGYYGRPGFLNAFTRDERNMIVEGRISIYDDEGKYSHTTSAKVFPPSSSDLISGVANAATPWKYFTDGGERRATLSRQAYTHSLADEKPQSESDYWLYWLSNPSSEHSLAIKSTLNGTSTYWSYAFVGTIGVRPALRLNIDTLVSDTVDEDGCYSVVVYELINAPTTIVVPSVMENAPHTVSWSIPTNIQSSMGSVCYKVEWAYDGGAFDESEIVSGTSLSRTVDSGHTTVQYRVSAAYASDEVFGNPSYSDVITIINNTPPTITGNDESIGTKSDEFSYTYSVSDSDSLDAGNITVEEAIDGNTLNSYSVGQGVACNFNIVGGEWLKLNNGSHTITITASDKRGAKSVRTVEFTKEVTTLSVESSPMESVSMPTHLSFFVSRKIPAEAIYKVEVCNNGFDTEPTWEDATAFSDGDNIFVFENKSKTADSWGIAVHVSVDRNGAEGECYITAIGGNFE